MTLRRKMGLQIGAMIVGLLLTVAASLWGLHALRQDYGLALQGYQELRQLYEVGSQLAIARSLLASEHADRLAARARVENAAEKYRLFATSGGKADRAVEAALQAAVRQLQTPPEAQSEQDVLSADADAVDHAFGELGDKASEIRQAIEHNQRAASAKHRATVLTTAAISAAAVIGALLLGIWQYRGVMLPLNRLGSGVRKVSAGQFSQRLVSGGVEEFASLSSDFNRMAAELDGFYHQLEQKVAQKSRELVRSERLASVGFLAAGVAHEINNPLGIISGYAEYTLAELKKKNGSSSRCDEDLLRSLQLISDEAFRCKQITSRLLSLARPGDESRATVNLADVADQVASIVAGLPASAGRTISVKADANRAALIVTAVEAEMKQVILNLTLNALDAIPSVGGEVKIEVIRSQDQVELSVSDNGKGMSAEILERVFEPFFTEKRGVRQGGTGLGLSISYAIIEDHGGSIRAQSDGPGRGSRFTVIMPALVVAGGAL